MELQKEGSRGAVRFCGILVSSVRISKYWNARILMATGPSIAVMFVWY